MPKLVRKSSGEKRDGADKPVKTRSPERRLEAQSVEKQREQPGLGDRIHSLNDPETEAIEVEDGSRYVGIRDATGRQTTVLCPNCGSPVHGAAHSCPVCSEEVKGDPKWELVRCTNCRKTFPDTRDTCPACNSEQASLLDHVECAGCEAVFNPARGSCPACESEEAYTLH